MPDFPTFADLFRTWRDEALSRNPKLTLDAVDRDGSDANIIAASSAAVGEEVVAQLADVAEGLYLDSARGKKLDRYVFDRYGLVRKTAAVAVGEVEFSTTAPNPTSFTIPVGTALQTADGRQFFTTAAAIFPAGSTGPITAAVRSALAGADQNARIGAITNIVSTIPLAPADLAVTNGTATAGAADEEGDDSLRDRARRFFLTARKGTLAAIEADALSVPGIVRAVAFDVVDVSARPTRVVELVVSDQFTDALVVQGVNPPAYEAQSQALADSIFNALRDTRAGGIFVKVVVAQVVLQPIILQLRFQAGVDVDLVTLVARGTVLASVNDLEPGETLSRAALVDRLRGVAGLQIVGDEIASPPGDVVPAPLQVIRTSLSLVQAAAQSDQDAAGAPVSPMLGGGGP